MTHRATVVTMLVVSLGLGAGLGLLAVARHQADRQTAPAGSATPVASDAHGSGKAENRETADVQPTIQSIRGIEGIDAVQLQNLETVLRMQSRTTEQKPRGTPRAAAALMTMEPAQQEDTQEQPDGRMEQLEIDLTGS
jgi:hypothetical protein